MQLTVSLRIARVNSELRDVSNLADTLSSWQKYPMTKRLVAASLVVTLLAYLTSPVVPILPILLFGGWVAWRGQEEPEESVVVAEEDEPDSFLPEGKDGF